MNVRRSAPKLRLVRGWERGFSPAAARILGVASEAYRGLLGAREWLYKSGVLKSRRLGCPVVAIGNLTVGGTGKTPAVILAAQSLSDIGFRPAVVSRGYGRRSRGVQVVADTASIRLDVEEGGDEPFLIARRLPGVPVVVAASRYEAARFAVDRFGVTAIVLDDGFQHRTLEKDLEIVMARARYPWGNERLLPGGPLREPLEALARADLVVAVGARIPADATDVARAVSAHAPGVPVLGAVYVPTECWEAARMEPIKLGELAGTRLLAFAGIGTPNAFRETLAELGTVVRGFVPFPDHHLYTADELRALRKRAAELGADALITTEKDWVRLRRLSQVVERLYVLGVRLHLTSGEPEWRALFVRACRTR